jgi:hypothetical protein
MNVIDIGGVKISYSSLQGLGKAVEEELARTNGKLADAVRELKKLRRAQRALKQMLGDQKAKPTQTASSAGTSARELAGASR